MNRLYLWKQFYHFIVAYKISVKEGSTPASDIWRFHGGENEDRGLLCYDVETGDLYRLCQWNLGGYVVLDM